MYGSGTFLIQTIGKALQNKSGQMILQLGEILQSDFFLVVSIQIIYFNP
jgi:excinuclease UvrABC helicase subunit UvrB